jgi:DNA-directed RNA polymerase specialized sigma24 family protein
MDHIEAVAKDIHEFVSQRIPNGADAADIAQEVLTIACSDLDKLARRRNGAALFAIAQKVIADYHHTHHLFEFVRIDAARPHEQESALQVPPESVAASCDVGGRITDWLRRCDQALEPAQQIAVLLADIYGYADKESAMTLGMSVASFKLLLHTARYRLRTYQGDVGRIPAAIRRARIGVVCHVDCAELKRLRESLVDGLYRAVLAA